MLQRAIDAGVPFAWVTRGRGVRADQALAVLLEERCIAHVLATKVNDTVITVKSAEVRADDLVAALPMPGIAYPVARDSVSDPIKIAYYTT